MSEDRTNRVTEGCWYSIVLTAVNKRGPKAWYLTLVFSGSVGGHPSIRSSHLLTVKERQHFSTQQRGVPQDSPLGPLYFCQFLKMCFFFCFLCGDLSCAAFRLLIYHFLPIMQKPLPAPASKSSKTYVHLAQLHRLLSLWQQGGISTDDAEIDRWQSKREPARN